jgi:hypothetical protein
VRAFLNIVKEVTLSKVEKDSVKKFIKRLNKNRQQVTAKILHKALKSTLEEATQQRIVQYSPEDLTTLEIALINLDCQLLLQKDPTYIQKRDQFKSGDKICINQREYTLKDRQGSQKANDQNIIHTTDDPAVVIG